MEFMYYNNVIEWPKENKNIKNALTIRRKNGIKLWKNLINSQKRGKKQTNCLLPNV